MHESVLIVEDQFVEANDLHLMLQKAGYRVTGIARSVPKALELIEEEKPDVVLLDIFLKGPLTGIDLAQQLYKADIPFVYLSANSNQEVLAAAKATQPDGFLVKPFREKDVLVTLEVARYRHDHSLEASLKKETLLQNQLKLLMEDDTPWEQKLLNAAKALQPYLPFEYMSAGLKTAAEDAYHEVGFLRISFDEYQVIGAKELMIITNLKQHELNNLQSKNHTEAAATWYEEEAFMNLCASSSLQKLIAETFQVRSHLILPVPLPYGEKYNFSFYSRRPDAYRSEHLSLLSRLQPLLIQAIERNLMKDTGNLPTATFKKQVYPLADPRVDTTVFEGIVGSSHLLLTVFDHITLVAPTDTSVLILGESGTGKEKMADCIHALSPRKSKPLIRVNCATLPATLIESELFGHEKGSFTGATERRIGKFEQAAGGTIFLDEIGELPLEMQVKLLRVLQEKEIERIGGRSPLSIDVRIIAATNRNLEKEVAEGRFRLDLYYRLHVFPIQLPALRERKEDIPALVSHFIQHYNRKAGRKITGLTDKVMNNLMEYEWPGNIRELEHVIERSVLLTKGAVIEDIGLPDLKFNKLPVTSAEARIKTMDENERDHIIAVLKKCNGRIWGIGGAAELLNVPPTTLHSKMKKLGIKKEFKE